MSSADQYLFEETLEGGNTPDVPFLEKQVIYALDQNGGSYNGQIQIDTSTLANSGKWLDYSSGYIQVPFVFTWKNSGNAAADSNSFMVGLKNGYHQIIDSIQVDYNNTNVVQLQPFTNFYVSYKLMTEMSPSDVKKWGTTIGFAPDSSTSFKFSAAANANGDGYSNNQIYPLTAPVYGGAALNMDVYNDGLAQRTKNTGYPVGPTLQAGYGGVPTLRTAAGCQTVGKSYAIDNAGVDAARVVQWNVLATIRLKDVADFFDKMPLVKGALLRFTINYNSATTVITGDAGPLMTTTSITMNSGRTNPLMMTSAAAANPMVVVGAVDGTNTISCGIKSCTNSFSTPALTSCRLYVPAYDISSEHEQQLISLRPVREVIYNDIYNFNVSNIAAAGNINSILTNGIVNPKKLIVIPFANASAGVFTTITNPVYQSVFDTAPATSTPMAALTNFNVQLGGKNLFQQNFNYDFETFINEVSEANAINGGKSTGLTSGLISHADWDNGYRYYVADLSRRLKANDSNPISVVLQGTNASGVALDLVCFVSFERHLKINMLTGELM